MLRQNTLWAIENGLGGGPQHIKEVTLYLDLGGIKPRSVGLAEVHEPKLQENMSQLSVLRMLCWRLVLRKPTMYSRQ